MISTANKSEIAVLNVELEANKKGYSVSLPKNQAARYDLIIDDGIKLYKVQVKYLNRAAGKNCVELKLEDKRYKNRKCYTSFEIDLMLVYIERIDKILAFGPKLFENKKTIRVNLVNPAAPTYYQKFLW